MAIPKPKVLVPARNPLPQGTYRLSVNAHRNDHILFDQDVVVLHLRPDGRREGSQMELGIPIDEIDHVIERLKTEAAKLRERPGKPRSVN